MIYLESFTLPLENRRAYPYNILYSKSLQHINFQPVTIFYGNNGSGKSTLLNLIADKIGIKHKTLGNTTNSFYNEALQKCNYQNATNGYGQEMPIPCKSRFIRSEDVLGEISHIRQRGKKLMI